MKGSRLPPIRTFIRSERLALASLTVVGLLGLLVLAATIALKDQRRLEIVLASPAESDDIPSTTREIQLTFSREPDHSAVEAAFSLHPPVTGTMRWRGKTLVFIPDRPMPVGQYEVSLKEGKLGRGEEPLKREFRLQFSVREPGIAAIVTYEERQELVEIRPDGERKVLLAAPRIIEFAVSPDGSEIAVVTSDKAGHGGLALVDERGQAKALVQSPAINIGGVVWSPDGNALVVIRRDLLPNGLEGVPRAWLARRNGEFVAPIDPDGNPTLNPSWSPDGQRIAYISPSDAKMMVRNLTTEEVRSVGQPRGGAAAWSVNSEMLVFESVPTTPSSNPPQPIRVVSLDGFIDKTFGVPGEVRIAPKFWDDETVASLRRTVGATSRGTELVFESIRDGKVVRAILLVGGPDLVLDWDIAPSRQKIVFSIRGARNVTTFELDLESGSKREVPIQGDRPRWVP